MYLNESKVRFTQASNHYKRVLEAAKLVYANKTNESTSLPTNLALRTFGKLPIVFSTKVNLLYLLYSTILMCCLPTASDKAKLFAEHFSNNSNLHASGISLPVFSSRTNLKVHNISVTCKMA